MVNFDFEERSKKITVKKIVVEILVWVIEIALVIGLAFCIIKYAVEKTDVIGSSMETTLNDGDEIIINKLAYRFQEPKRFDVVVYKQSNREHSYYNVKRIIGLPGETIQIIDNVIYINGEEIEDIIIADEMNNAGLAADEIVLDENEYFVLGDNRNNSEDSRFANVGNITKEEIVGKAWLKLKPFNIVSQINLKTDNTESEEASE